MTHLPFHLKPQQLLPLLMMTISLCASGVYALQGDVRRAIYWAAGVVLTATVTF